tara:strand:- start:367 stop:972 length:606 start_codon:yes stop_codon:yes gene_type:complete
MKKILFIILLTIPFIGFGQTDYSVVPDKIGDYYNISNHPKSITNFGFRVPQGFNKYREGRDNSVIQIFRKTDYSNRLDISGKKVNSSIIEFSITVLKWRDFSKYKMMLSMSDSEIKELMIRNISGRDKSVDPNEFVVFYEKNDLFWVITGTWNEEKNLYLIMSVNYTNKQSIQLSFMTTFKENTDEDVKNIKKLIDSFKYL